MDGSPLVAFTAPKIQRLSSFSFLLSPFEKMKIQTPTEITDENADTHDVQPRGNLDTHFIELIGD
jgi:hypothetical protein